MYNIVNKILNIFRRNQEQNTRANTNHNIQQLFSSKRPNLLEIDPRKIYKHEFYPLRKLFIWGLDKDGNPSFMVLYGRHKFAFEEYGNNVLEDEVTYTDYTIFRGQEGHFPSFEAVEIRSKIDYKSRKQIKKMFYKKDLLYNSPRYMPESDQAVKDFVILSDKDSITFPYFETLTHETYVETLRAKGFHIKNFYPANSPEEVLALSEQLSSYQDIFLQLFSNPNIYMRKKALKELISSNPPKEIYEYILKVGSGELISGLFLEFAKQKNDTLLEEARQIIISDINWITESYALGVKRCAEIYFSTCNEEEKKVRIDFIRNNLSDLDLHLIEVGNMPLPEGEIPNGAKYRQYAAQGLLSEYYYVYSREERITRKIRRENLYKKSYYTDGVTFNKMKLKNTLQEANMFDLADVIGEIAYYLDAPRLTYHFKGNSDYKALKYFRSYVRRIMDEYAKENQDYYVEAMKNLFTRYQDGDYLCKMTGNFQYNYFIKHYLYHSFTEKIPTDWIGRQEWLKNDQHLKLEGRYEYMPEIWDRHLDTAIEIAAKSKIDVVSKAFYYILKDPNNETAINNELSYDTLIQLGTSHYQPLVDHFGSILKERVEHETEFNMELMIWLVNAENKEVRNMAMDYFRRTNRTFTPSDITSILLLHNPEEWEELFSESLSQVGELNDQELFSLLESIIAVLSSHKKIPKETMDFLEDILFLKNSDELKFIIQGIDVGAALALASGRKRIALSLLQSIQTGELPDDEVMINIIEQCSAGAVKNLIEVATTYKGQLAARHQTLIMLMESGVAALNSLAWSVFDDFTGETYRNMHYLIIDSPVEQVYSKGLKILVENYEKKDKFIPGEFIVRMLEHPAPNVKAFATSRINTIIDSMGGGNEGLFLYYAKTLMMLPNRVSLAKDKVYTILPKFVEKYRNRQGEVEQILLEIGGSNIIADSERALVAYVNIKKEAI